MRLIRRLLEILSREKLVTAEDVKGILSQGHPNDGRTRLPTRHESLRQSISFEFSYKNVRHFDISFGIDADGMIREVFCAGSHTQSDLQGILDDACIATSIALQRGARISDLAKSFGELRDEGATSGPPASPVGAIARAGATLEIAIREGRA